MIVITSRYGCGCCRGLRCSTRCGCPIVHWNSGSCGCCLQLWLRAWCARCRAAEDAKLNSTRNRVVTCLRDADRHCADVLQVRIVADGWLVGIGVLSTIGILIGENTDCADLRFSWVENGDAVEDGRLKGTGTSVVGFEGHLCSWERTL